MSKTKTKIIDDSIAETPKKVGVAVEAGTSNSPKSPRLAKLKKVRGKKYQEAKSKVDAEKSYPLPEALQLVKVASYAKFGGPVQLHIVLTKGSINKILDLPYSCGKTKKVEVASDETVTKMQSGKIDFDVLIAHPSMMPKLVPFARILGPRGLMPNPKNGTISDNPEEAAKKFGGNSLQVKSEAKAPLVHTTIGKIDQPEKELEENFKVITDAVGARNIQKAVIAATMGPSIKVVVA
ncbi:MAG: hypothetical protein HYW33_01470 [Candidatus Blackburnbacteria bacterium]|nr:hypothetical protein [Candidatus Blackburnbacteria bacterium]